jgi:hypothetical protein
VVAGSSIRITGRCTNMFNGNPAEDVEVKLMISWRGSSRTYWLYTSFGTGEFAMNFQPSFNEGGKKITRKHC